MYSSRFTTRHRPPAPYDGQRSALLTALRKPEGGSSLHSRHD